MMIKTIASACAVAVAAMGFSGAAFAQGHGHDRDGARHEQRGNDWRGGDRYQHNRGGVVTAPAYRQHYSQPSYQYRSYAPRYYSGAPRYYAAAPRYGYGYAPSWRVGGYYSGPRYIVSNWGAYPGLYAPPYGYQWVQTDTGDFLLVAIATGLIANLLAHSHF